jgi:hypothetical protein
MDNVWKNIRWAEGKLNILLIPDDGRKAETCGKIVRYGVSVQVSVLMEPNNTN